MITYPCPNSNQIMFGKQPQDNIEANWYASCHIIWTIMINHKGSVVDRCIFRWHLPVGRSVMDYVVPCLVQYIDVNIGYNFQIQPFVPCHWTQRRITQRANTSAAPIFGLVAWQVRMNSCMEADVGHPQNVPCSLFRIWPILKFHDNSFISFSVILLTGTHSHRGKMQVVIRNIPQISPIIPCVMSDNISWKFGHRSVKLLIYIY